MSVAVEDQLDLHRPRGRHRYGQDEVAAAPAVPFEMPKGVRPGVVMEGYLLKSPPEWSVRRVTEETRLKQRWFILSNRALCWYHDATLSRPLSSLPLALITSCERANKARPLKHGTEL